MSSPHLNCNTFYWTFKIIKKKCSNVHIHTVNFFILLYKDQDLPSLGEAWVRLAYEETKW